MTPHDTALLLDRVRQHRPRVHCLMNSVVQKFVADGLAALHARPSMTASPEEIADFATGADALLVNLGTLDTQRRAVIATAVGVMRQRARPWLLDPVHCDASPTRRAFAQDLLAQAPAVLRGNGGEVATLTPPAGVVRVTSGAVDLVACGARQLRVANGHPWMAQVTGTGCLSGAVIAAFLTVEPDALRAASAAMLVLGVAAELAGEQARGPGTFEPAFLDALAGLGAADLLNRGRIT